MAKVVLEYDVQGIDEVQKAEKELKDLNKQNNLTQKEVDQTNKKFDEQAKSAEGSTKAVGDLGGQLQSTANRVNVMGVGLGDLGASLVQTTQGTKAATIATRALGLAMKAVPIIALVAAFGTLISFFTKTQRGADLLKQGIAGVSATIDVLIDRASRVGEALFNIFTGQGNIFDNITKINQAFVGVTDEIEREAQAAVGLEKAFQDLQRREIAFIETQGELRDRISELVLQTRDLTLSSTEREKALNEAIRLQNALNAEREGIERERVRILQEQQALGENLIEDERELAEARRNLSEVTKTGNDQIRELTNRINELRGARAQEEKERDSVNEIEIERREAELEFQDEKIKKIEGVAEIEQSIRQRNAEQLQAELEQTRLVEEAKRQIRADTVTAAIALSGRESGFAKGVAIADTTISTYKAAQKAFESLVGIPFIGPALGTAAAAAALAAGFGRVRGIVSTQTPKFAEGGLIDGNSHALGGVNINAEGGEFVLRKSAVDRWGVPMLEMLNKGVTPSFTSDNSDVVDAINKKPVFSMNVDEDGFTIRTIRLGNRINRKGSGRYAL